MAKKPFTITQESQEQDTDYDIPEDYDNRIKDMSLELRKQSKYLKMEIDESLKIQIKMKSLFNAVENKVEKEGQDQKSTYYKFPVEILNLTWSVPQIFELTETQLNLMKDAINRAKKAGTKQPILVVNCYQEGKNKKYRFNTLEEIQEMLGQA